MVRWGRRDKGGSEPRRSEVIIRESGQGWPWCAGTFGIVEASPGEAAQPIMPPAPDEAGRADVGEDRVGKLLQELFGDVDG